MSRHVSQWVVAFSLLVCTGMGPALAQKVQIESNGSGQSTTTDGGNCVMSPLGYGNCLFPMCWDADVEYNPNTLTLDSVDLHEPDDPQKSNARVWTTFNGGDINQDVRDAALQHMRDSLGAKHYNQPCVEQDCTCSMPAGANWGPWKNTTITSEFDIANPNPKDPKVNDRLYYTAHGSVQFHAKGRIGHCDVPDVQE